MLAAASTAASADGAKSAGSGPTLAAGTAVVVPNAGGTAFAASPGSRKPRFAVAACRARTVATAGVPTGPPMPLIWYTPRSVASSSTLGEAQASCSTGCPSGWSSVTAEPAVSGLVLLGCALQLAPQSLLTHTRWLAKASLVVGRPAPTGGTRTTGSR